MYSMQKYRNTSGFTLMEILIVLVIVAGAMSLIVGVVPSSGRSMRQMSKKFLSLSKYVYYQSVLKHKYYRIVLDLDEQNYKIESSEEPFFIVREGDEQEEIREDNEDRDGSNDEEEENDQSDSDISLDNEPEAFDAVAQGLFEESEDDLLEEQSVPDGMKIQSIYVDYAKEPITQGKVALYYFPRGYTQFAVIHLSDTDEEDFMTLVLNPLTGQITVINEFKDHLEIIEEMQET